MITPKDPPGRTGTRSSRPGRHRRATTAEKSWWETHDLPRIIEIERLLAALEQTERAVKRFKGTHFLPVTGKDTVIPITTPLVRARRDYSDAFALIRGHLTSSRAEIDADSLLVRARSLPQLYEWWCMLLVWRVLQKRLRAASESSAHSPSLRLAGSRDRFLIELESDEMVDFDDGNGYLVRLRYQPEYRRRDETTPLQYGVLGAERLRTPDISVEVFRPRGAGSFVPDLIIVFDAKYSSLSHAQKLDEVRRKYANLGVFASGRILSRQVWALVPGSPDSAAPAGPTLRGHCTTDNDGFWSSSYDMSSTTCGAVQALPGWSARQSPVDMLLSLILERSGVSMLSE